MVDTKIGGAEGGSLGSSPGGTEEVWAQNSAGTTDYWWTANDIKTWCSASPTLVTPALGTPASGTLTNCSGLPITGLAAGTSANLAGVISDETGSGALVFANSPTLVTPALGTPASGNLSNCTAAGEAQVGPVELATTAEIDTATDAGRAMCPDQFNASDWGLTYVQLTCFDYTTDTATGDGAAYFATPSALAGYDLVEVHAEVITAGTTGTTDIQIANVTQAADILSTKLTIDSGETGSDTAATPAVIDTAQDDITAYDLLRVDVDAVSTTAAKGLIVTLGFRKP